MIAQLILAGLTLAAAPEAYTIDDVAFLAGHWRADVGGTLFEEITMPPSHGNMTTAMRMIPNFADADARTKMWELVTIDEEDGGLVMRLRHFNPGLTPWSAEDGKPPLTVTATEVVPGESVVFSDLTESPRVVSIGYVRTDAGVTATVLVPGREDDPLVIEYVRVD